MDGLPFIKMHGLGNDFVIIDARTDPISLGAKDIRAISDRRTGVGCDQLIVLEPARDTLADAFMRIHNADGNEVGACGNVSRCVGTLLMAENGTQHAVIETQFGLLDVEPNADGRISVDMGPAQLDWRDIPLSEAVDTLHLGIGAGPLVDPVGVGIGNPHAVFFVDDAEAIDMEHWGPMIEHHAMFPERTNVEAVQVLAPDRLRMRVWERGVGVTMACGTGACATLVAAARRKLTGRKADVVLDGGVLSIEWLEDNHVLMTGPVATSFRGIIDPSLLS
ncbi:MAG: diaminopimelate epimerase [Rhodospirillales bacterium]|nr:diaminopimelate epimerase [Rhodospirillales bacterium]MCW8861166.1 diaminopimelate epimerase [Rhodospirillales bacterium]